MTTSSRCSTDDWVEVMGLEPTASSMRPKRSSQLSYTPEGTVTLARDHRRAEDEAAGRVSCRSGARRAAWAPGDGPPWAAGTAPSPRVSMVCCCRLTSRRDVGDEGDVDDEVEHPDRAAEGDGEEERDADGAEQRDEHVAAAAADLGAAHGGVRRRTAADRAAGELGDVRAGVVAGDVVAADVEAGEVARAGRRGWCAPARRAAGGTRRWSRRGGSPVGSAGREGSTRSPR